MHLSQPPVKNMLSSKGWNFKAKTFLPCPDSGAKMSSSLQKSALMSTLYKFIVEQNTHDSK